MEQKPTDDLMKNLKSSSDLDSFFKENQEYMIDKKLAEYLTALAKEKKISKSEIFKKAEINDLYGYQIFSGNRKPSRDKLFSLCRGMNLSLEETQSTLKLAEFAPLYPKSKRDCILIMGIEKMLSVFEINQSLFDNGEKTL